MVKGKGPGGCVLVVLGVRTRFHYRLVVDVVIEPIVLSK